eukprot:m.316316 g.316316  ORF g.316316 m.316316 type:complete len:100 (+) comp16502_c0_seq4:274-573(+)
MGVSDGREVCGAGYSIAKTSWKTLAQNHVANSLLRFKTCNLSLRSTNLASWHGELTRRRYVRPGMCFVLCYARKNDDSYLKSYLLNYRDDMAIANVFRS